MRYIDRSVIVDCHFYVEFGHLHVKMIHKTTSGILVDVIIDNNVGTRSMFVDPDTFFTYESYLKNNEDKFKEIKNYINRIKGY